MKKVQVKWIKSNDWYNNFQKVEMLNSDAKHLVIKTDGNIENMTWEQICKWYQQGHTDSELTRIFNVSPKKVLSVTQSKRHHLFLAI